MIVIIFNTKIISLPDKVTRVNGCVSKNTYIYFFWWIACSCCRFFFSCINLLTVSGVGVCLNLFESGMRSLSWYILSSYFPTTVMIFFISFIVDSHAQPIIDVFLRTCVNQILRNTIRESANFATLFMIYHNYFCNFVFKHFLCYLNSLLLTLKNLIPTYCNN